MNLIMSRSDSIKMILILIFGFLSSSFVYGDLNRPLLQEFIVPKNLKENQTFRLLCALTQGENVNFKWSLNKQKLESNNKRKIKLNDDSSELIIKSLSIDDFGNYQCTANNKHGEDTQSVSLNFNVKPKWTIEPQDVIARLFEKITLKCDVMSYPSSLVKWVKLDENKQTVIKEFESNEISFELTKESSGFFKCNAFNSMGSIERIINVGYFGVFSSQLTFGDYLSKPLLQELIVPRNLVENKTIKLICSTIQGEFVEFDWFLNDKKLIQNDKRKIIVNQESSDLVIKSLSIDDLGVYRCIAKNKLGQDEQKISLNFNVKPRWSKEPFDVIDRLSKEITLECNTKSFPSAKTQWFKMDESKQKITKQFEQSNRLDFELTRESAGFYKCKSHNSIGSIEKIISVGYFGE